MAKAVWNQSGTVIVMLGVMMIILAIILFIVSIIYRKTAGKKIREELMKEYNSEL